MHRACFSLRSNRFLGIGLWTLASKERDYRYFAWEKSGESQKGVHTSQKAHQCRRNRCGESQITERGGGEGKVINACGQTPGFPSLPHLSFLALAPFFKRAKHRESRSKVFLCFPTPRRFATQAPCINYFDQLPYWPWRSLRKTSEHLIRRSGVQTPPRWNLFWLDFLWKGNDPGGFGVSAVLPTFDILTFKKKMIY